MSNETVAVPAHRRTRYLRDQRLRELGYSAYEHYITSWHWQRTRARFYRRHPAQCICGVTGRLILHHKTYERLGAERMDDLVLLCAQCHHIAHALQERGDASLDLEAVLDKSRAARNQEAATVRSAERAQGLAEYNAEFFTRLRALPPARRVALAKQAALARHIDVEHAVRRVRAVQADGRPEHVVERWLRVLERKAFAREFANII